MLLELHLVLLLRAILPSCLCKLNVDLQVNLPKGSGYVEFKMRADAEKAQAYMDGVRLDYNAELYN